MPVAKPGAEQIRGDRQSPLRVVKRPAYSDRMVQSARFMQRRREVRSRNRLTERAAVTEPGGSTDVFGKCLVRQVPRVSRSPEDDRAPIPLVRLSHAPTFLRKSGDDAMED